MTPRGLLKIGMGIYSEQENQQKENEERRLKNKLSLFLGFFSWLGGSPLYL